MYRGGPDRTIRRDLLSNYRVEGVVALPAGRSRPHSTDDTNLLVFRRAAPLSTVRFLRVPDAGPVVPRDVAAEFREGKLDGPLWQVSVQDLEIGDWELLARKSGHKALARKLKGLGKANPEVETRPLKAVADVLAGKTYQTWNTVESTEGPVAGVGLVRAADITDSGIRAPSVFLAENSDGKPLNPEYRLCFGDILFDDIRSHWQCGGRGRGRPGRRRWSRYCRHTPRRWGFRTIPQMSFGFGRLPGLASWTRSRCGAPATICSQAARTPPSRFPRERFRSVSSGWWLVSAATPLAGIVRVLTNTEDPVVEWVQESAEVRDLRRPVSVEDGVALLERIAGSIRKLGVRVARPDVRTHPDLAEMATGHCRAHECFGRPGQPTARG